MTVLLAAMTAGAQKSEEWSRWSVTPKAGLTVATLVGDDATDNSSSLAWAAGLEASYRPTRLWSLDFGLDYTRERVKEKGTIGLSGPYFYLTLSHGRLLTERIDMPLLVGLHVLPCLTLKAGLQPSLLLSATETHHVSGYTTKLDSNNPALLTEEILATMPHETVDETWDEGVKSQIHDFDLSLPVGASYEWRNIVVDARYHFSLGHTVSGVDAFRRYLSLTLGYRFGL